MCSYNFIDGVQSCSNHHFLVDVLKGELNFQGFVQSDWWAVLYPSFMEGLDQEPIDGDSLDRLILPHVLVTFADLFMLFDGILDDF